MPIDPYGANLDRIPIVQGRLNKGGKAQENGLDVIWGDADRHELNKNGNSPPGGNAGDIMNAGFASTLGGQD